jgi:hypothetical protein
MNKRKALDALAAQINAEHDECTAAFKRGLDHAMRAGDLLIQAKALVGHGKWLPWFREHCPYMSERTAQVYMRLARHRTQVESAGPAGLTIDGVLATLAWPSGWEDGQPELPALSPRTPKFNISPYLTKESDEDRRRNEERRERLRQKETAEIARFRQFFVDNPGLNDFHASGIGYHWAIAFGREQCKFIDAVGLVTMYEAAPPEQQQKLKDYLASVRPRGPVWGNQAEAA